MSGVNEPWLHKKKLSFCPFVLRKRRGVDGCNTYWTICKASQGLGWVGMTKGTQTEEIEGGREGERARRGGKVPASARVISSSFVFTQSILSFIHPSHHPIPPHLIIHALVFFVEQSNKHIVEREQQTKQKQNKKSVKQTSYLHFSVSPQVPSSLFFLLRVSVPVPVPVPVPVSSVARS